METTTKIELIDVKEDSDLLLKTLMEARVLLSRIETYQNWLFWTVIISLVAPIFGNFLTYIFQIKSLYWLVLFIIPITYTIILTSSLDKLISNFNNIYQRCASMASKIAQNIEKNQYIEKSYSIPKYALSAIDLYENDKSKAYVILSSLRNTISIIRAISAISIIAHFSYGSLLSHQENQNKQLKTQIDSLNRVNQELIKKELKNK